MGLLIVALLTAAVLVAILWAGPADSGAVEPKSEAGARFSQNRIIDDPVNGAWSRSQAEAYSANCSASALPFGDLAKHLDARSDPAYGAWNRAQAEFYEAKFGAVC
jgi:hypothetical protein